MTYLPEGSIEVHFRGWHTSAVLVGGTYRRLVGCDAPFDLLYKHERGDFFMFLDVGVVANSKDDRWVIAKSHYGGESGKRRDVVAVLPKDFDPPGREGRNPKVDDKRLSGTGCLVPEIYRLVDGPCLVTPHHVDTLSWSRIVPSRLRHGISAESSGPEVTRDCIIKLRIDFGIEDSTESKQFCGQGFALPGVVAPLTRSLSESQLPAEDFFGPEAGTPISDCSACYPQKPPVYWGRSVRGPVKPVDDPTARTRYERDLIESPKPVWYLTPFRTNEVSEHQRLELAIDPDALRHRASKIFQEAQAKLLPPWRLEATKAHIRARFRVQVLKGNSDRRIFGSFVDSIPKSLPSHIPQVDEKILTGQWSLFDYQRQVVSWAQHRESGESKFEERETEEFTATNLSIRLTAVAKHENPGRGGVIALDVGQGKTIVTLALIRSQLDKNAFPLSVRPKGFIPLEATVVVVPFNLVSQWSEACKRFLAWTNFAEDVIEIKKKAWFTDGTFEDKVNSIKKAKVIIVALSILDTSELYGQELEKCVGLHAPTPSSSHRAVVEWHRSAMVSLRRCIEACGGDPTTGEALKAFIAVADEEKKSNSKMLEYGAEIYQKVHIMKRTNRKTQNNPSLETAPEGDSNDAQGSAKGGKKRKNASGGQGGGGKRPRTTSNKDERFDGEPIAFLELFSFARAVWDESSYGQVAAAAFMQNICAEAKWILTGTPSMSTLDDICRMADVIGVHVASKRSPRIPGLPLITKGPDEDRSPGEQCREGLSRRKTADWALARHNQAIKFVKTFFFKPPTNCQNFSLEEKIVLVDPEVSSAIAYHTFRGDAASAGMWFTQMPARARRITEGLTLRAKSKDPEGQVAEILHVLASSPPSVYLHQSNEFRKMNGYMSPFFAGTGLKALILHDRSTDLFNRMYEDALISILFTHLPELKSEFDRILFLMSWTKKMKKHGYAKSALDISKRFDEEPRWSLNHTERRISYAVALVRDFIKDVMNQAKAERFGGELGRLFVSIGLDPNFATGVGPLPLDPKECSSTKDHEDMFYQFRWYDWYRLTSDEMDQLKEEEVRYLYKMMLITRLRPATWLCIQGQAFHSHSSAGHDFSSAEELDKLVGCMPYDVLLDDFVKMLNASDEFYKRREQEVLASVFADSQDKKTWSSKVGLAKSNIPLLFRKQFPRPWRDGLEKDDSQGIAVKSDHAPVFEELFHAAIRIPKLVKEICRKFHWIRVLDSVREVAQIDPPPARTPQLETKLRSEILDNLPYPPGTHHYWNEICTLLQDGAGGNAPLSPASQKPDSPQPCFGFGARARSPANNFNGLTINLGCGHVLPDGDLRQVLPERVALECPVEHCHQSVRGSAAPLRTFASPSKQLSSLDRETAEAHGRKLLAVKNAIKALADEDKVIVFCQGSRSQVLQALEKDESFDVFSFTGSGKAGLETAVSGFVSHRRKSALLLELTAETSAGMNLQVANHVMFVAPLLETNVDRWDMLMKQAIGRSVRHGQTRGVTVHHFATKFTLEVDILETRLKKCILANEENEVRLVEPGKEETSKETEGGEFFRVNSHLSQDNLRAVIGDRAQNCEPWKMERPGDDVDSDTIIGKIFHDMAITCSRA